MSTAFVSILNGVFLNVMPEITVSFALAAASALPRERQTASLLTDLIAHGLRHSGVSFAEKLGAFDPCDAGTIEEATARYNQIRASLLASAEIVDGVIPLLTALRDRGIPTYTTSVVPQVELDAQMRSISSYARLFPLLDGALGDRPRHKKLEGHLELIEERVPGLKKFFFLFDAPSEIRLARAAAAKRASPVQGVILPFGEAELQRALANARRALPSWSFGLDPLLFDAHTLPVPSVAEMRRALLDAGADEVTIYAGPESLAALGARVGA